MGAGDRQNGTSGGERRAHPRRRPSRTVIGRVAGPGGQSSQGALLVDASAAGLSLLLIRALEPPELLLVELPVRGAEEPVRVAAKAVRCDPQADGGCRLACALLTPLDHDLLQALLT